MNVNKLKKFTAGIAMATLIGSSVPTLACAHSDSHKEENQYISGTNRGNINMIGTNNSITRTIKVIF
ncbi:hypothetical protein [Peribacillus glennii]|uniref:Uncharacterized protein n=1 Tax=Peribacillus glennii TaxID=2303991 RepID=A0A372L6U0_9BACI|nr:hypothetical protein [Peribacillus glennii]RFU60866.1 hypothetical protein D0466_20000 [Peribacillus glennii]